MSTNDQLMQSNVIPPITYIFKWTSIVSNRPRPTPFIDSDTITPVSFEDRIVRGSQRRKDISRSNSLREERSQQHGHPISHRPNLRFV